MGILPLRSLRLEKIAKGRPILWRRFPPIALNGVPALAKAFFVGVTILGNNCGDALGMRQRQSKSYRRTIIKHIKRVTPQGDFGSKRLDYLGEIIECILEP